MTKMKIFVYNYREFDEAEYFQKFAEEYGVELGICTDAPTLENAHLAEGYKYVSIITSKIDARLMERFRELGVKTYLVTDTMENKKNLPIQSEYTGTLADLLQFIDIL